MPVGLEPLDEVRAEEAAAAGDEDAAHARDGRARREPVDAAEPAVAVLGVPADRAQHALLPRDLRLPAGLARQLLVADAERHHLARARPEARRRRHDLAVAGPEAVLLADAEDQVDPVAHRDVRALPVDVDVAGDAVRGDGEVAADAVGAEAEVAQRLELAELDRRLASAPA